MSNWELPVQGPSVYEKFKPRHIALAEAIANQSRENTDLQALFYNAKELHMTPDEQDKAQMQSQLADMTSQFIEATKDLPDAEYEQAKQQFISAQQQYTNEAANIPQRQQVGLEAPNPLQMGLALFGAALNPQFAADIVSAPFAANTAMQGQKQGVADKQYEDQLNVHRERLQVLGTVAQQAQRDFEELKSQRGDKARRLASAIGKIMVANKPGEASLAFQEAIDAGLPADRVKAYGAMVAEREKALKAEAEKAGIKTDLEIQNQRALLQDRQNAPAKEAEAKATKAIDDFRQWVSVQYPADRALGKTEIAAINAERLRRSRETGVPIGRFDIFGERGPSISQEFSQQRYKDEAPARQQDFANKVLEGQIKEVDLAKKRREFAEGPVSKDKAARGKKLASLNTKIENAKIEVDAILQQPVPEDPDERAKYFAKLRDAFATETAIVQLKRKAMGGKVPTLGDYLQERFPGAVPKLFGIIDAAAPGTTGKVMSDKDKRRLGKGGSATPVIPGLPGVTKAG